MTLHEKLVNEIVEKYKPNSEVIAINVMGSVSRGEEKPNSDLDIEIVTNENERIFNWERKEKSGISIDFIFSSKGQILYQIEHYPFFLLHKDKKLVYDSEGFMKKIKNQDLEYIKKNPKVRKFWDDKLKEMKKRKSNGEQKESLRDIFDEAETLFSKNHMVTRDWFRK